MVTIVSSPEKEFGIVRQILTDLIDESAQRWGGKKTIWGEELDDKAWKSYNSLINRMNPLRRKELETLFDDERLDITLGPRNFFYLPPLEVDRQFIPVMTIECNVKAGKCSLRVELWRLHNERWHALGVRFETPSGKDHTFRHAQLFHSRAVTGQPLPDCPTWLPVTYPAFPLNTKKNIASLIGSLVLAFWGERFYNAHFGRKGFDEMFKPSL